MSPKAFIVIVKPCFPKLYSRLCSSIIFRFFSHTALLHPSSFYRQIHNKLALFLLKTQPIITKWIFRHNERETMARMASYFWKLISSVYTMGCTPHSPQQCVPWSLPWWEALRKLLSAINSQQNWPLSAGSLCTVSDVTNLAIEFLVCCSPLGPLCI